MAKPTALSLVQAQAAEIAALKARIEELETSLSAKVEGLVQAALVQACAIDAADHAIEQAKREDRNAARPAIRPEPLPRPEGYTAWQCDARALKLRARGFESCLLAYKAGGLCKIRADDGSVHDTTVSQVSAFLAGQAETPF